MGNEFEMFLAVLTLVMCTFTAALVPNTRQARLALHTVSHHHSANERSGTPPFRFNAIVCKIAVFLSTVHAQVYNLIQLVYLQKTLLIFSYHQHVSIKLINLWTAFFRMFADSESLYNLFG